MEVFRVEDQIWNPTPRESAVFATCNMKSFLIGGLNYEASKEIGMCKLIGEHV